MQIVIKDMEEMPSCCNKCPLLHFYIDINCSIHFICKYKNVEVSRVDEKRSDICPLVEIESEETNESRSRSENKNT